MKNLLIITMLLGVGYSQSECDDCEELNDGQFNVLDDVVLAISRFEF